MKPWRRIAWSVAPWLAAMLSGGLLILCFPPFDQHWLAWLALTPLIATLWFGPVETMQGWRKAFYLGALGWVFGAVFFIGCFSWLTTVTVIGWIALCHYLALFPALWCIYGGMVCRPDEAMGEPKKPVWMRSRYNLLAGVLLACGWVGQEWLRGVLFTGFGWNPLAVAIRNNIPLLQIADIGGVGAVSFVVLLINAIAVLTVKRLLVELKVGAMRPHYDFGIALAVVAFAFAYGIRQILAPEPPSIPVRVAAIQPNIPQDQKWDPVFRQKIVDTLAKHSETAMAFAPDLLIWPEAATPGPVFQDKLSYEAVRSLLERFPGDFLLGTVHFDQTGDYNSALLFTGQGQGQQIYHKVHLVPFGEYLPLRDSFPPFVWIAGDQVPEDFDAGSEPVVLELSKAPVVLAPLICFEDTLGDLTRRFVRQGAQLLVTLTNDGWFLRSAGSAQHLANAVMRCAENKRPLVRAANTGVTCFVDRFGRVSEVLATETGDTFIEGVLAGSVAVPENPSITFYTRYGDLFAILALAAGILVSLGKFLHSRRKADFSS